MAEVKNERVADAAEYEQKFHATAKILEQVTAERDLLERKLGAYREEVKQYVRDLGMFHSEYAWRRKAEVLKEIEGIEGMK